MLTNTGKTSNNGIKRGDWNMIRVAQYNKARKSKYRIRITLLGSVLLFLFYLLWLIAIEFISRY